MSPSAAVRRYGMGARWGDEAAQPSPGTLALQLVARRWGLDVPAEDER